MPSRPASQWRFHAWRRKDPGIPIETRTRTEPCPHCGAEVTGVDAEAITVLDNPTALICVPDPYCPHNEDPDADCTCVAIPNPAPDPLYDTQHVVGWDFTLRPCGHHVPKIKFYTEERPEPGTLGALMNDWEQADE